MMCLKATASLLCVSSVLLLGLHVDGYSIKDATPKEDSSAMNLEDKKALMEDVEAVLAEQNYQAELAETAKERSDKAALEAVPSQEKLKEAFDLFDQDGNGAIDHQDLRAVINAFGKKVMLFDVGDRLHNDVLDDLLGAADEDQDGQVTFKDYSG